MIGNIFAWILGLGVFFLTVDTTNRSTGNGARRGERPVRIDLRHQFR
ncbi:hypothetical protein [Amycolatopsis sp. DSM 110486]|nr:hypothetical protein [Amycolatopsis sp. DSM 110486]QYN21969.1 hypothetical protein K1T34_05520 [Amycolatopsis sp. DSM 110486]